MFPSLLQFKFIFFNDFNLFFFPPAIINRLYRLVLPLLDLLPQISNDNLILLSNMNDLNISTLMIFLNCKLVLRNSNLEFFNLPDINIDLSLELVPLNLQYSDLFSEFSNLYFELVDGEFIWWVVRFSVFEFVDVEVESLDLLGELFDFDEILWGVIRLGLIDDDSEALDLLF